MICKQIKLHLRIDLAYIPLYTWKKQIQATRGVLKSHYIFFFSVMYLHSHSQATTSELKTSSGHCTSGNCWFLVVRHDSKCLYPQSVFLAVLAGESFSLIHQQLYQMENDCQCFLSLLDFRLVDIVRDHLIIGTFLLSGLYGFIAFYPFLFWRFAALGFYTASL